MTVENEPEPTEIIKGESERDSILTCLARNTNICFKSQQKWESDLTLEEKFEIGLELFVNNKLQFLIKFGKYLKYPQLQYFRKVTKNESNFQDIDILLNNLLGTSQQNSQNVIKNRRYQAMVKMIQETTYFSEIEMMKRNPLLYNQLIGQYLTADEVKERDKYDKESSFVKILMEGIERDNAEEVRQHEEEIEKNEMLFEVDSSDEDLDGFPQPSTSHWGEIAGAKKPQKSFNAGHKYVFIKPEERKLLKDEFTTTMYESFLSGKDKDFDYETVDNDTSYDDMDEINNDKEEKYFDSEDINENCRNAESSEDELDAYMNTLS